MIFMVSFQLLVFGLQTRSRRFGYNMQIYTPRGSLSQTDTRTLEIALGWALVGRLYDARLGFRRLASCQMGACLPNARPLRVRYSQTREALE